MDAHVVVVAAHIAARQDVGGIVRSHLLAVPRQAHGPVVNALGSGKALDQRTREQSGIDGCAVEGMVAHRCTNHVLVADVDIGQTVVRVGEHSPSLGFCLAGGGAKLAPLHIVTGAAQHLEGDVRRIGRNA